MFSCLLYDGGLFVNICLEKVKELPWTLKTGTRSINSVIKVTTHLIYWLVWSCSLKSLSGPVVPQLSPGADVFKLNGEFENIKNELEGNIQLNQSMHLQPSSLPLLFFLFFYCTDIIRAQYHRIWFAKCKIQIFSHYYGYIRFSMASFIPLAITGFLVHKFTTVPCTSSVVTENRWSGGDWYVNVFVTREWPDKHVKHFQVEFNIF